MVEAHVEMDRIAVVQLQQASNFPIPSKRNPLKYRPNPTTGLPPTHTTCKLQSETTSAEKISRVSAIPVASGDDVDKEPPF